MKRPLISSILFIFLLASCAQGTGIFPQLGEQLATPSAMTFDAAASRLYVVNSNAEVLYDWTQGSFQVFDVTDPLAPALIKSVPTASFSGQIYLDQAAGMAYVPNRYSPDAGATEDRLYIFDVDEASPGFGSFTEQPAGLNAYAIDCCYPADRAWVTTSEDGLQYFDLAAIGPPGSLALTCDLDTGGSLTQTAVNHIARNDPQAFLSREYGGVLVVNLDKAGDAGSVPVDYWISDIPNPEGIAFDGSRIWVVGEGNECDGDWCRFVQVVDVAPLVPRTGNTTAARVDKDDAGLLIATIEVGKNPQEVLLSTQYAFVTNQDDDTVTVIDRATYAVVATVSVGEAPFSLALYLTPAGDERYLYVGNVESNTLSIIDISTLAVVATYP
ncbi:MAG: hypothetical protein JXA24_03635 [Proteobacteria bacterium]|nr:hypothetical protein [Pseudomonadota bacterium]